MSRLAITYPRKTRQRSRHIGFMHGIASVGRGPEPNLAVGPRRLCKQAQRYSTQRRWAGQALADCGTRDEPLTLRDDVNHGIARSIGTNLTRPHACRTRTLPAWRGSAASR